MLIFHHDFRQQIENYHHTQVAENGNEKKENKTTQADSICSPKTYNSK